SLVRTVALHFVLTDTAPTSIYTLSLHDALPIYIKVKIAKTSFRPVQSPVMDIPRFALKSLLHVQPQQFGFIHHQFRPSPGIVDRSEEHTSELQSRENLVCRLLLEKKKSECAMLY